VLDGDAIFVPSKIPRQGKLALRGTGSGSDKIELVFAGGTYGVRKRLVPATLVSVAEVLPLLLAIDPNETSPGGATSTRSLAVWAAAAAAGVGLVARGRLLPTVGADDVDAWRVGPLDPSDMTWLRELAAAFPPAAHALGVPGSRPMRMRSARWPIRTTGSGLTSKRGANIAPKRPSREDPDQAKPQVRGCTVGWAKDRTLLISGYEMLLRG
jgi:hypothetical protein